MRLPVRSVVTAVIVACAVPVHAEPLRLDTLIDIALAQDPLLAQSASTASALRQQAIAAGALPDPSLAINLANVPTDTFEFAQEAVTQVSVGVTQAFPAGDTRALKRERFERLGEVTDIEMAVRAARVRRDVTGVWLKLREARLAIETIEAERTVFDQLLASIRSGYRNAAGRVNQQDVIRAGLEATRLDERILGLGEQGARTLEQLSAWIPRARLAGEFDWTLPLSARTEPVSPLAHPEIVRFDRQIAVARTEVALARTARRPGYRISASYAYRDHDLSGRELPDFVSLGVSVDLPLFKANRQDREVAAAADRASALESARAWKAREITSRHAEALAALAQLDARRDLYLGTLLSQFDALAQAAMDAYGNGQGEFAEVMRAYVARLDARVDLLRIETRRCDLQSELAYLAETVPVGEE